MIELKKLYLATDFDQRRVFYAGVDARRAKRVAAEKHGINGQWLCAVDGYNVTPIRLVSDGFGEPTIDIGGAEIDLTGNRFNEWQSGFSVVYESGAIPVTSQYHGVVGIAKGEESVTIRGPVLFISICGAMCEAHGFELVFSGRSGDAGTLSVKAKRWVGADAVGEKVVDHISRSENVPLAIGLASDQMGSTADKCSVFEWNPPVFGDGVIGVAGLIKPIVDELCNAISAAMRL